MLKALSWRMIAVIITTTIIYAATGEVHIAAKVGAIDTAIKLYMYYLHERIWDKVRPAKEGDV